MSGTKITRGDRIALGVKTIAALNALGRLGSPAAEYCHASFELTWEALIADPRSDAELLRYRPGYIGVGRAGLENLWVLRMAWASGWRPGDKLFPNPDWLRFIAKEKIAANRAKHERAKAAPKEARDRELYEKLKARFEIDPHK